MGAGPSAWRRACSTSPIASRMEYPLQIVWDNQILTFGPCSRYLHTAFDQPIIHRDLKVSEESNQTEKCQFDTEKCQFDTEICQFETEKCQFETEKCLFETEKCQLETEKCQFYTEKCQFYTEKCQIYTEKCQFYTEKSQFT